MKKVIVLAAAIALFATPALSATIINTLHDLSSPNAGTSTEVCVYCHTPHSANTAVTLAPLWNRTTVDATSVYSTGTLHANITTTTVNATDAPLCLSCHDGTVGETLQNEPNNGTTMSIARKVPVKTQGRFSIPPCIPISSRTGLRM